MSEYINMSIFEYFLSEKREKCLYSGYRIAMAQIYIVSPEKPKIIIFQKNYAQIRVSNRFTHIYKD